MNYVTDKNFEETNYLIYLVKNSKNNWAWNKLWNKYHKLFYWHLHHEKKHFHHLNHEIPFLTINIYQTFYEAIIHFEYDKKTSFKNFFLQRWRWKIIDISNEISNKNRKLPFLNYAQFQNHPKLNQNPIVYLPKQTRFRHQVEQHIQKFSKFEQQVLKLRLQGFKNSEITNILNFSNKQIANTWERIKKKLKRYIIDKKSI